MTDKFTNVFPPISTHNKINIVWLRRDLRLDDHAAFYQATLGEYPILPIFIFDNQILGQLHEKNDARVTFIHQTVSNLKTKLQQYGTDLYVFYGQPKDIWRQLLEKYPVAHVFASEDYEPYALQRDQQIKTLCMNKGIKSTFVKDHVIFAKNEVIKNDGTPYTVFTPYKKKWLETLHQDSKKNDVKHAVQLQSFPNVLPTQLLKIHHLQPLLSLKDIGFERASIPYPLQEVPDHILNKYAKNRDYPGIQGTSKWGIHFRFGTISIREKARKAIDLSETFLSELIWRDFYAMILFQFPYVAKNSFRPQYDKIEWRNDPDDFAAWCMGKTGYPIVDAGMRELAHTGYMHNRVRMITASFLTKHLLIDWRWGEAWFARHLLDFDLASNNGGWQWAAGCGTDAAPYFRIFNPYAQTEKFDPDSAYINKWVPEWNSTDYPKPIVDHSAARIRCLDIYKKALKE